MINRAMLFPDVGAQDGGPQVDAETRRLKAAVKCFTAKSAKFAKTL